MSKGRKGIFCISGTFCIKRRKGRKRRQGFFLNLNVQGIMSYSIKIRKKRFAPFTPFALGGVFINE